MRNLSNVEKIGIAVIITFIALIVTSSILVSAYMNSLTIGPFLVAKDLTITNVVFTAGNSTTGSISLTASNTETRNMSITIAIVKVNGVRQSNWSAADSATIPAGGSDTITITTEVATGNTYNVKLLTIEGTMYGNYTATA